MGTYKAIDLSTKHNQILFDECPICGGIVDIYIPDEFDAVEMRCRTCGSIYKLPSAIADITAVNGKAKDTWDRVEFVATKAMLFWHFANAIRMEANDTKGECDYFSEFCAFVETVRKMRIYGIFPLPMPGLTMEEELAIAGLTRGTHFRYNSIAYGKSTIDPEHRVMRDINRNTLLRLSKLA